MQSSNRRLWCWDLLWGSSRAEHSSTAGSRRTSHSSRPILWRERSYRSVLVFNQPPPYLYYSSSLSNSILISSSVKVSSLNSVKFLTSLIFLWRGLGANLSPSDLHLDKPRRRFLLWISASLSNFLRSNGYTPMRWRVSISSMVLIRLSRGDEELNDGHTLTSSSHAFKFASSKTSNP